MMILNVNQMLANANHEKISEKMLYYYESATGSKPEVAGRTRA